MNRPHSKNARFLCGLAAAVLLAVSLAGAGPRLVAAPGPATSSTPDLSAAKGDVLLEALLTELARSKDQLRMDNVPRPYYIEYRVSDLDSYSADASFGALREEQQAHLRFVRAVVRVGDYKQDSYYREGMGQAQILPLDDDPIALRHQIWLATDEAYKAASEALTQKQAALKEFTPDPEAPDDFARAPAIQSLEPPAKLQYDAGLWRRTLEELTGLYKQYPDVQTLSAVVRFNANNEYFVNSEGAVTRTGSAAYSVQLMGSTQAPDGMRLSRSPYWAVAKPEEMLSPGELRNEMVKMLDTLTALRQAPIIEEDYRGPVVFSADAAADVFDSLIGGSILGRKPQLGRPNRTTGEFATSYKMRVLPAFLTVVDDPTVKDFQGHSLTGSYDVDSEGVRAAPVTAIDRGILLNYLLGRQPIRDFPVSNGHGRAAPGASPQSAIGNLFVRAADAVAPEALKERMLDIVREQGKPYGYLADTLGPGNTPRVLYRVWAKDGHAELVRGAAFNELDVRSLRNNLVAAGNDPLVDNRVASLATTIVSPSILFDELEVKRANTSKDKLPEYPAPPLTTSH